uniref:dual specificity protein phosphatase 15 isoform X3 n=1 Tax=Callithrix jacchus TaxID=9483 RepID=UPI00159DF26F|nr:dual specificity protein phosphatase 15 isoform X3 [Callithrix jacchus]
MGNGMTKVLPGLYLGNFIDAKDLDQLGRNKITHIISIHESPQPLLQDITYLRIPVADTPEVPIKKHFKECINFIHCCRLNGGNCLVHCSGGKHGRAEAGMRCLGVMEDTGSYLKPEALSGFQLCSSAGSWRSASARAPSATRRSCARCFRCAGAADRAPRPRPPPPGRTPPPPREPCSAWCRARPGKLTGRCRCWRASSRLSLVSRGVCPARAASEDAVPPRLPTSTRLAPFGGCLRLPRSPGRAQKRGEPRGCLNPASRARPAPPRLQAASPTCASLCPGRPAAATWCLSPWAGGGSPPLKAAGGEGGGPEGWTGLEDIKETQKKLPVRVPPSHSTKAWPQDSARGQQPAGKGMGAAHHPPATAVCGVASWDHPGFSNNTFLPKWRCPA